MPVVRELVNRISFKVNKGDLANVDSTFDKFKGKGKGLISFFGTIGGAISKAALAFAGFQLTATKLFVDFQKDTGASNFFARNKSEAEALLKVVDEIQSKSETTSRRESRQAAKTFSTLNIQRKQLEEIIPFIEKISIARPDLDFTAVAESLKSVVKGGDIQELINLVPGIKQDLEILSKTSFGKPFGEVLEQQRIELVLESLRKNQDRLNELVAEQRTKIPFFIERVSKETSDFFLNFGENTAEPMKELLAAISATIKEINESDEFWEAVRTSAEATKEAIKEAAAFLKDSVDFIKEVKKEGLFPTLFNIKSVEDAEKLIQKRREERRTPSEQLESIKNVLEIPVDPSNLPSNIIKGQFNKFIGGAKDILNTPVEDPFGRTKKDQSININAEIKLTGENVDGLDLGSLKAEITRTIKEVISPPLKAITNENGGAAVALT